MAIYLAHS